MRIKIAFANVGSKAVRDEMQAIQEQFRATTGKLLTFEGWASFGVAQFKIFSHFV